MTRKTRKLLITLISLAVIITALILTRLKEKPEESTEAPVVTSPEVLSDFTVTNLRTVRIIRPEGVLGFSSSDGENWIIDNIPKYFRVDSNQLTAAVRSLSKLQSRDVITESAGITELTEFGLNPPEATIQLKDREGKTAVVEIGMENPSKTGRYSRRAESETIVLIPSYSTRTVFSKPDDFRDMSLPTVAMDKLAYFEFRHDGITFRMEPDTGKDPYVTMISPFIVTSHWHSQYSLDDHTFQTILSEEAALPSGVLAYLDNANPDDPVFGLNAEDSDMLIIKDQDENSLNLIIGDQDGRGNRYIRFGDHEDSVFLLHDSDLAVIGTNPFRLISKFVFLGSIFQVAQVKVERDSETWIMRRTERGEPEDTDDDRFVVNNLEVPKKEFTSVYQKFIGLMYEGEAVDKLQLKSPEVRITISNVDPGTTPRIIRYWPYNETYYQVSIDSNPIDFLVGRYQVDDFIEDLAALSEYGS